MKMIYRSRTKRSKGSKTGVLLVVLVCCLALGLFARSILIGGFSSLGNMLDKNISGILPAGLQSVQTLSIANKGLEQQVLLLTAENADRNILANENERLKSAFGANEKEKIVYATILRRPPFSLYDTLILDAGSERGIQVNDVVVFGSVAIGTIVESGKGYGKAQLFSSAGNVFDGMLGGNIAMQAKGLGGGAFESVIPLGASVSIGDAIILPAISSKIFGLVQKIEDKQAEGFKRVLFTLPINVNQINSVGVIIH